MIFGIFGALAAIFSVSSGIRVHRAKERFDGAAKLHDTIMLDLDKCRGQLSQALQLIGKDVIRSVKSLKQANQILTPIDRQVRIPRLSNVSEFEKLAMETLHRSSITVSSYNGILLAGGVGLSIGSVVAVGSYAAVAALGTASTGTAIATLHGAAAASAILAAFGHGALAAGGTGMLGGKLALGGIVLLPVAVIMGFVAHTKADEIIQEAVKIETANRENSEVLSIVKAQVPEFDELTSRVQHAADELANAVKTAQNSLFRYGVFSKIYKLIRLRLKGNYYNQYELIDVERLVNSIDRFLRTIGANKSNFEYTPTPKGSGILMLN
jgi:hypothetical protein